MYNLYILASWYYENFCVIKSSSKLISRNIFLVKVMHIFRHHEIEKDSATVWKTRNSLTHSVEICKFSPHDYLQKFHQIKLTKNFCSGGKFPKLPHCVTEIENSSNQLFIDFFFK